MNARWKLITRAALIASCATACASDTDDGTPTTHAGASGIGGTFDNPHDETIGYGESTRNEMCYFVGFAVDLPSQSACLEVLPPSVFQ